MDHREITTEERRALERFAKTHGRKWRDQLVNVYWYNARIWTGGEPGDGPTLQNLRNTFGPSWLYDEYRPGSAVGQQITVDPRATGSAAGPFVGLAPQNVHHDPAHPVWVYVPVMAYQVAGWWEGCDIAEALRPAVILFEGA